MTLAVPSPSEVPGGVEQSFAWLCRLSRTPPPRGFPEGYASCSFKAEPLPERCQHGSEFSEVSGFGVKLEQALMFSSAGC